MLFLLYGTDTFRLREKLKELKDKFKREIDSSGLNLTTIKSEKSPFDAIKKAISVSSFLAKKRMVVIENSFNNKDNNFKKNLLELLKNQQLLKDAIVILVEEIGLDKKKKRTEQNQFFLEISRLCDHKQEFKLLSEGELSSWIKKRVTNNNGSISNQATELLASYTGPDLWALNNEINKLTAYKNGKEITEEDIVAMVKAKADDNIFKLTDAVGQKNNELANHLIDDFIQNGFSENYILNMLIYQFKNLLLVKSLQEDNYTVPQIRTELNLHPFVLQKTILQARQFSMNQLKKIYNKLLGIDKKIKTSQINPLVLFNLLIIELND